MAIARVRVEARRMKNDSDQERDRINRILVREFQTRVQDAGLKQRMKEYQYYESKGELARKKKKELELKHQQERIFAAMERGENPKGAGKFRRKKKKQERNSNFRNKHE